MKKLKLTKYDGYYCTASGGLLICSAFVNRFAPQIGKEIVVTARKTPTEGFVPLYLKHTPYTDRLRWTAKENNQNSPKGRLTWEAKQRLLPFVGANNKGVVYIKIEPTK